MIDTDTTDMEMRREKGLPLLPLNAKEQEEAKFNNSDMTTTPTSFAVSNGTPGSPSRLLPPDKLPTQNDPITFYCIWDDLGVSSYPYDDFDLHLTALQQLFDKCRIANFKLRLQKLQLAPETLKLIGYEYRAGHLHIPAHKLQALKQMATTTGKQVLAWVATASYLRSFTASFSNRVRPLLELARKPPKEFKWTKEHQDAKDGLIKDLEKNQKRYLYTPGQKLILSTDASHYCMASTLEAVVNNRPHLVASFSRMFNASEFKHNAFFKEAHCLLASLVHFSYYLRGATNVKVITDVRAIVFLRLSLSNNMVAFRLSSEISKYNFQITHANTTLHHKVDSLTRLHKDQPELEAQLEKARTLTIEEALTLTNRITIEHGQTFTAEEAIKILTGQSPPSLIASNKLNRHVKYKQPTNKPHTRPAKRIVKPVFKFRSKATEEGTWRQPRSKSAPAAKRTTTPEKKTIAANAMTLRNRKITDGSQKTTKKRHKSNPTPRGTANLTKPTEQATTTTEENMEINEKLNGADPATLVRIGAKCISTGQLPLPMFIELQSQDTTLGPIRQRLKNNLHKANYTLKDDLLVYKTNEDKTHRICLPTSLVPSVCHLSHFTLTGTHRNRFEMTRKISQDYYHRHLQRIIDKETEGCAICAHTYKGSKSRQPYQSHFQTTIPRIAYYIDLLDLGTDHQSFTTQDGKHDISCTQNRDYEPQSDTPKRGRPRKDCTGECIQTTDIRYLLIASDVASGYIIAHPMQKKTEREIYNGLQQAIFTPFLIPHLIISDGESGLTSEFVQARLKEHRITHRTISKGASWANKAEIAIQQIKRRLRPSLTTQKTPMELLPIIINAQNATPNILGITPETIMFSATIGLPTDLLRIVESKPSTPEDKERHEALLEDFHRQRKKLAKDKRDKLNLNHKTTTYEEGQLVTVRDEGFSGGSKSLKIANTGPYTITAPASDTSYVLKHMETGATIKRHANTLTAMKPKYISTLLTPDWDTTITSIKDRLKTNKIHTNTTS